MCGRFALYAKPQKIAEMFSTQNTILFEPSYNIAPTQMITVVCEMENHERVLALMRWGLVPSWMKEEKISGSMINARAETIESKPAFRTAIRQRRCLIVANGFYEWRHNGVKQPYYIHEKGNELFGMAGIWERWVGEDRVIDSCSIITVEANKAIKSLHDRMPAIIQPDKFAAWLDTGQTDVDEVKPLLLPYTKELDVYPVTTSINKLIYNCSGCVKPIIL